MPDSPPAPALQRHFGLLQATALNVTMVVGAGVFVTIPLMRQQLQGPWLLLGWVVGALLMFADGLVWAELGAAMPGSGGSYLYLLESYGRTKLGRAMAFLFIWQFLISGPLELASGLIAMATFAASVSPAVMDFNKLHTASVRIDVNEWAPAWLKTAEEIPIGLAVGPTRIFALAMGVLIIVLLYRRITALGKLTVTFWIGVLAVIAWLLLEGTIHGSFSHAIAPSDPPGMPDGFGRKLGNCVALAMYSYFGYYNICYIGDEVRQPGRTIPQAIMLSSILVATLFVGLSLAMLAVVPWFEIPTEGVGDYSLPAAVMREIHGDGWAPTLVTLMLVWSCFGSAFAGMLGCARIPYGAAKQGHFYAALASVHPRLNIPHVSLLFVGAMTLMWSFFDLDSVIKALIVTRILEQFVAQCIAVMVLRRTRPDLPRPFRMWLYPLPSLVALVGWLALYFTTAPIFILLGVITLLAGIVAFLLWSRLTRTWPFGDPS